MLPTIFAAPFAEGLPLPSLSVRASELVAHVADVKQKLEQLQNPADHSAKIQKSKLLKKLPFLQALQHVFAAKVRFRLVLHIFLQRTQAFRISTRACFPQYVPARLS